MTTQTAIKKARAENKKFIDQSYMMNVIDDYNSGEFDKMKSLILDYGKHEFFQDLFEMLTNQNWRSRQNCFLTFVGITIQFMKYDPGDMAPDPDPVNQDPAGKVYYCSICHINPVDVFNGFDTCPDCLNKM